MSSFLEEFIFPEKLKVALHHFAYKHLQVVFRLPAKFGSGFGCVTDEKINFCRTEITWVNGHHLFTNRKLEFLVGAGFNKCFFIDAFAFEFQFDTCFCESESKKFSDWGCDA